jgi:VanZ family protein
MALLRWITLWRVLAVLVIALIWVGSLWPADELRAMDLPRINDKVGHFLGYFSAALLLALGWRQTPLWALWLVATVSGGLAELAQGFLTTTRGMEWLDFVANGAGATVGVLLGALLTRWHKPVLADSD